MKGSAFNDRAEKVKKLRSILAEIDAACATCCHVGTWFCNRQCPRPGMKEITVRMLEKEGAFVDRKDNRRPYALDEKKV